LSNTKRLIFSIALAALLLAVGISVFLIMEAAKDDGATVVVSVNGEHVAEYSLSRDGEYSINGGTNILVIKNGMAYMKHADCPDKLCVNTGKICRTSEKIVCLPNRVMVEVIGADEEIFIN